MSRQDNRQSGRNNTTGCPKKSARKITNRRQFLKATGAGVSFATVAGCLGGGGDGNTIKIGHLAPLEQDIGIASERSAEIMVDEINEDGGILDQDVELVVEDTQASAADADSAVQTLVARENVDMIFGTWASETTLGVMDRIAEAEVPFFVNGAATTEIQSMISDDYDRYKNTFRCSVSNSEYIAEGMADYGKFLADEHGWETFAVIAEDAEWTGAISEITANRMEEEYGLDVPINERIALDTNDWGPILDEIESEGAMSVMQAFSIVSGVGMLSEWQENEYPFAIDGTNVSSMSPRYWDDTNGNCLYQTSGAGVSDGSMIFSDKTESLVQSFEERYDSQPLLPMYMGIGAYDSGFVYKNAVEEAGTVDDLDAIVDALLDTDYEGASRRIRFFGEGEEYPHDINPDYKYMVPQWQEGDGDRGVKVPVYPEEYSEGSHQIPDWM